VKCELLECSTLLPPALLSVGDGSEIDRSVILGYRTGRDIPSLALRIGSGARLRSGTVLYAGSQIGRNFQTGQQRHKSGKRT